MTIRTVRGLGADARPVGWQAIVNPRISRRSLLGGMAAAPVLLYSTEAVTDTPAWYDLEFRLSEDLSSLTVTEIEVKSSGAAVGNAAGAAEQPNERVVAAQWTIVALAFGPNAYFDMAQPAEADIGPTAPAPGRTVFVRNVQYGLRHGNNAGGKNARGGFVGFRFERPGLRWTIAYVTDLWLRTSGALDPIISSRPAEFHVFSHSGRAAVADIGRPLPFEDIADSRVDRTLEAMFGGLVRSAAVGKGDFRVTLDASLVWTVTGRNKLELSAMEGRARMSRFSLAWRTRPAEEKKPRVPDSEQPNSPKREIVYFSGESTTDAIRIEHREGLVVIGDPAGHSVLVKPAASCDLRLDTIVAPAPLASGKLQAVSALTLGKCVLAVGEGATTLLDGLAGRNLVLAETMTIARKDVASRKRTVLWGETNGTGPLIGTSAPYRAKWSTRGEILLPIGLLRVGEPIQRTDRPVLSGTGAALPADETATGPGAPAGSQKAAPLELTVTNPTIACEPKGTSDKGDGRDDIARHFQIANGDRQGMPGATLYVLHDRPVQTGEPVGIRRIQFDMSLFATNAALPDTSYSRLTFRRADLRLVFEDGQPIRELANGEYPLPLATSFAWVGPLLPGQRRAVLDLGGATLACGRDYDLMKLRLRFRDLLMEYRPGPRLLPARDDARTWVGDDGAVHDTRPILVAEFDPQHVLEEAIFRPEPPPLPDIDLEDQDIDLDGLKIKIGGRDLIVRALAGLGTAAQREKLRGRIRDLKVEKEGVGAGGPFATIANAFGEAAGRLPVDQRIYIGPFELDPDAMAIARKLMETVGETSVRSEVEQLIARIAAQPGGALKDKVLPISATMPGAHDKEEFVANALRNERLFESTEPFYGVFRNFWRDTLVQLVSLLARNVPSDQIEQMLGFAVPAGLVLPSGRRLTEFLAPNNRPLDEGDTALMTELTRGVTERFVQSALGRDPVPNLLGARLSGRTRLAFRIDCEAPPGASGREAGAEPSSGASPAAPSTGSTAFRPMPFTFEALTDWSRFEPAVTRRARKLFERLPSGVLPQLGRRGSNASDQAMMRFQGFSESPITGEARMSEVRASLASERVGDLATGEGQPFAGEPLDHETAIEIPARLILSTAQDAVWRTNRRMPPEVYAATADMPSIGLPEVEPAIGLEEGEGVSEPKTESRQPRDLWSVRLETADSDPGLRAVASPDLRPAALGGYRSGDAMRLPGHGAPPRGPYAPWFIGPEQMESSTLTAEAVATEIKEKDPAAVCVPSSEPHRFRLIRWLCERAGFRDALPVENFAIFRTALDAFDRHQLVLQSSAYGLPVIGKRELAQGAAEADVSRSGGLIADSGQIEPGEAFSLLDGTDDQALHKPVPLSVKALTLSALGGSLAHETAFRPSAGADDIFGRKIFEGFSIDTLQQDIVLGRDVRTEVVYKGYLLPLGHKASFVKLTERIFLRTPAQGVKAMLRQRMFLRMSEPDKRYGALGQPFAGRMWCGKLVTLLADKTPDILDPNAPAGGAAKPESLNGRIDLGTGPGLAFWPRTDITESGVYRFEVAIDGSATAMPMIFVDNIAATTAESLKQVVEHYNGQFAEATPRRAEMVRTADRRRTVSLGGQKIDYAPNSLSGEAQFETDTIRVRTHGRLLATPQATWTGSLAANDSFLSTGVLQGADQPPFYPAMEEAVIRLGPVERMSGGEPRPVAVHYDGHYVLYGFAGEGAPRDAPEPKGENGNPKLVFLNLAQAMTLSMGGNADRSGGIARPESHIVAIGRDKGPLGGDESTWWSKGAVDRRPSAQEPIEQVDGKPVFPTTQKDALRSGELKSLAYYFNDAVKRPSIKPAERELDEQPPFELPENSDETIKQIQSFFSLDAKLLGTIKLKDLMLFLGITADSIPVLKETQEFGTAALRGVGDQLDSLSSDVRTRVLAPLLAVVTRLKEEWEDLDKTLADKQRALQPDIPGKTFELLTLASIYPEVDSGLDALSAALEDALKTEDAVALVPKLAAIHTAARRLVRGIVAITSNPVERLEEAVIGNVRERISDLTDRGLERFADIVNALNDFKTALTQDTPELAAEAATNWIFERIQAATADVSEPSYSLPLGTLVPDLGVLLKHLVPTIETDAADFWTAVAGPSGIGLKLLETIRAATRAALPPTVKAAILGTVRGDDVDAVLQTAATAYIDTVKAAVLGAAEEARNKLEAEAGPLENAIERQAALALQSAVDRFVDGLLRPIGLWYPNQLDEMQGLIAGLNRIRATIDSGRRLAAAVRASDTRSILEACGAFAEDLLGIDVADLRERFDQQVAAPLLGGAKAAAYALFFSGPLAVDAAKLPILLREVEACAPLKQRPRQPAALPVLDTGNQPEASNALLLGVAKAIAALQEIESRLPQAKNALGDSAILQSGHQQKLLVYHDNLKGLIAGDGPKLGLVTQLSEFYSHIVDVQVSLRDLADAAAPAVLDEAAIERIGTVARALRQLGEQIADRLRAILTLLAEFASDNHPFVSGGLILGSFASFLESNGVPLTQLDTVNAAVLTHLRDRAAVSEKACVNALVSIVRLGLALVATSTAGPADALSRLKESLRRMEAGASAVGFTLDPEITLLIDALTGVEKQLAGMAGVTLEEITLPTLRNLLDAKLSDGRTLKGYFKDSTDARSYREAARALRGSEAAVLRQWRVLQLRLRGVPDSIREAVEHEVAGWGMFDRLSAGYATLLDLRLGLLKSVGSVKLFAPFARRALLVETNPALAAAGAPACEVGDVARPVDEIAGCDRLAQEAAVVEAAKGFGSLDNDDARAEVRRRIVALFRGWSTAKAAPIVIIAQSGEMAKDLLRGDILAAIDFAAFRDQIEDAIAALIPTKINFSYDFNSYVKESTGAQAIFQPKLGAEFGIKVRAALDLLNRKSSFSATAYLGPFDIYLIGGVADALWLKFGGAAFTISDSSKARFDVKYEDFKIGKDLEFAQPLQEFLSPKEGNGVFIQPMTRSAGIEAGYGINLGTIGVGFTSFFNVSLNVSAELPFGDEEALFKVSLGRRLSPFSMGVLPFVGSGYFSIYAAPDGVRGFEAAFEYGGGAGLGFGPLQAQCRISVGVFVRVLRVNGRKSTEIYGTFFAGGSASIWIFHFATSLYVRLGTAENGEMYGEAIYSFSFSLGIADYDYSITAMRKEQKLGTGAPSGSGWRDDDQGTRFAAVGGASLPPGVDPITTASHSEGEGHIIVAAADQTLNWDVYSTYFETSLLEGIAL